MSWSVETIWFLALLRPFDLQCLKSWISWRRCWNYLIYCCSKCVSEFKGIGPIQGCQDIFMYYIGIVFSKKRKYIFRKRNVTTHKPFWAKSCSLLHLVGDRLIVCRGWWLRNSWRRKTERFSKTLQHQRKSKEDQLRWKEMWIRCIFKVW